MIKVKILYNYDDENLYCTFDKDQIRIGEKYAILIVESYDDSIEELPYRLDNLPLETEIEE